MKKLSLVMVVLLLGICIAVPGLAKEKMKLAVTAVLHPYFAPMESCGQRLYGENRDTNRLSRHTAF